MKEKKGSILSLLAEGVYSEHSDRQVASVFNMLKTVVHKNKMKQQTL